MVKKSEPEKKEAHVEDNRIGSASLILRIGLGLVFIITGAMKLLLTEVFAEFIETLGWVPVPIAFTYLLGVVELALGLLLFIGFFTRIVAIIIAALLVIFLVVVMIFVDQSPINLALIAAAVAIVVLGPGNLAVDNALK